jgi:hypothetical protein
MNHEQKNTTKKGRDAEALAVIEGVEGLTDSGLTVLDYLEVPKRRKASKSTSPGKGAVQSTP